MMVGRYHASLVRTGILFVGYHRLINCALMPVATEATSPHVWCLVKKEALVSIKTSKQPVARVGDTFERDGW
jgi:hypothetical protein